jgi:hypothetical protein
MPVIVTWNELPNSVRMNLCAYYLPQVKSVNDSVIERITKELDIKWNRSRSYSEDSTLEFTDQQWMMFILKWS